MVRIDKFESFFLLALPPFVAAPTALPRRAKRFVFVRFTGSAGRPGLTAAAPLFTRLVLAPPGAPPLPPPVANTSSSHDAEEFLCSL